VAAARIGALAPRDRRRRNPAGGGSLAGTGAMVWDLLAEPASLSELVATFTEVYPDDPGTIARDVATLLETLQSFDAIEAA